MQQLPKTYSPKIAELKWYTYWLQNGFFKADSRSKKVPYTIVMPPPNITGTLHMGHILNNTIQDVLIRKARMEGKEACWIPGIDHAAIATEAKVVAMLKEQGLSKRAIGREKFLSYVWEWKEKYSTIILEQLKKIGISCDWDRTRFTLEESLSRAVQDAFIQLYEQGYIYQGKRMIHWDPKGETALSDDEVYYKSITSQLYYIRYTIADTHNDIIVATTRPETILGDTALCVHPDDLRYQHIKKKQAIVPIINRVIPIIEDSYVDRTFGTGCLKVTPAHDMNDYLLSKKYQLEIIDIFNSNGTLNEAATYYVGEDRFVVRQKIVQQLKQEGKIEKIENYIHNIGFSERTHAIVEPRLSTQWFVAMHDLAQPALDCVLHETIQFYPSKFKKLYQSWISNIKDWCISRQLWWGHPIPAYYLSDGSVLVAKDITTALEKAKQKTGNNKLTISDLKQDQDVLDTWFSSWLWPIAVFKGLQNYDNEDINYFYPTDTLVTAPDIIFFWVARMIMAGYAFKGMIPFKKVYFTGIVRDTIGQKMSKSLGNSPDPLELIEKYGADSVRIGMLCSTPAGNDLLFHPNLCEQGKRFLNKIWNSFRLIQSWKIDNTSKQEHLTAILWFHAKFNQVFSLITDYFLKFRISDALVSIYKLIWDDFCAWYLEMVKPSYEKPIAQNVYHATCCFFEELLKLLHPFAPFITEELWHQLRIRQKQEPIIIAPWPIQQDYDTKLIQNASFAFSLITQIRNTRNRLQIPTKKLLTLYNIGPSASWLTQFMFYIQKIGNVQCKQTSNHPTLHTTKIFHIEKQTFYILLHEHIDQVNKEEEKEKQQTSILYLEGLLAKVMERLNNELFLKNAPPSVIAKERKKQLDIQAKIRSLQQTAFS